VQRLTLSEPADGAPSTSWGFTSWQGCGQVPRGILVFNNLRTVWAYPPIMSTSQVLQQLYSLDTSSPNLSRYLYCLIQRDEEEQYLSGLQESELRRLVDFLDEVRALQVPPFIQLRSRSCRLLAPSPPPTMFTDSVCTNYKPSVLTT